MKKLFIRSMVITAALALVVSAAAHSYAASETGNGTLTGVRIGYVDFTRALNQVSDGKEAKKRLRSEFKEKQQRLNKLQSELTGMKEGIDRDKLMLSDEALKTRESAYQQKLLEVQRRFADFRREMSEREGHITEEILIRLRKICKSIGETDGYSLILEKSQDLVVYVPKGEDLTDRVIKEYNSGSSKKGK
jgi:outer membrane protein